MNRRSFIQAFLGACVALAVQPEKIMPAVVLESDELNRLLMADLDRIRGTMLAQMTRRSPWMDLLDNEPRFHLAASGEVIRAIRER